MVRRTLNQSRRLSLALLIVAPLSVLASERHTVLTIAAGNLTTYETQAEDRGDFFLLTFQVPAAVSGKDMDAVLLEFYVDAGAFGRRADLYENAGPGEPDAFINDSPTIEIFLPKSNYQGGIDSDALDLASRAAAPVRLGQDRRVVVDVTTLMQGIVSGTKPNYGLVLGSITGMREGDFTIRSNRLGSGVVARLLFYPSPSD